MTFYLLVLQNPFLLCNSTSISFQSHQFSFLFFFFNIASAFTKHPVCSHDFSSNSCAGFKEGACSAWRDSSMLSNGVVPEAMTVCAPAAVAIAVGATSRRLQDANDFHKRALVLVCQGCHNKVLGDKQQKFIFSLFWRLDAQIQGVSRISFFWRPRSLACRWLSSPLAFIWCLPSVFLHPNLLFL